MPPPLPFVSTAGYAGGAVAGPIMVGSALNALQGSAVARLGPPFWAISALAFVTAVAVGSLTTPPDPTVVRVAPASTTLSSRAKGAAVKCRGQTKREPEVQLEAFDGEGPGAGTSRGTVVVPLRRYGSTASDISGRHSVVGLTANLRGSSPSADSDSYGAAPQAATPTGLAVSLVGLGLCLYTGTEVRSQAQTNVFTP